MLANTKIAAAAMLGFLLVGAAAGQSSLSQGSAAEGSAQPLSEKQQALWYSRIAK